MFLYSKTFFTLYTNLGQLKKSKKLYIVPGPKTSSDQIVTFYALNNIF